MHNESVFKFYSLQNLNKTEDARTHVATTFDT